jgi:hypothetical protein
MASGGSDSFGRLPGLRGSFVGVEGSYILWSRQVAAQSNRKGGRYQFPPALSLRSNTLIFLKYFSASNAAAVAAPIICQSISRVGGIQFQLPAAPAPIMATDLMRCSSYIIRARPVQIPQLLYPDLVFEMKS